MTSLVNYKTKYYVLKNKVDDIHKEYNEVITLLKKENKTLKTKISKLEKSVKEDNGEGR